MRRVIKASLFGLLLLCRLYFAGFSCYASSIQEPELTFEWEDDFVVPEVEEPVTAKGRALIFKAGTLPEQYDARAAGVITSVKYQGWYEVCWAMAAAQMAESSLISKGELVNGNPATGDSLDLSERHLAYFMYHSVTDPLGNTAGDATEILGRDYLMRGGHPIFTTFALANWVGMAEEGTAPWQEILDNGDGGMELSDDLAYENAAHMQNAYWINTADMDHIKKAIMNYGSVVMPMYYAASYYNAQNASYYNHERTSDNHSVSVIGWDDTYPADKFGNNPGEDGAFLVKNSYGDGWGDGGFFWMSYKDMAVTKETGTAYVFDFYAADNYDNNYQYDGTAGRYIGTGGAFGNKIPSGGKLANVFQISENAGAFTQAVKAVSFSTLNANLSYSIQIYKNPADAGNPESGEALLSQEKEGTTLYTGYYTIPLDTELMLERGDKFAVVITLRSLTGSDITYCADYSYQNGDWIRFVSTTGQNQSFVMNESWQDLHAFGAAARVKAFTDNVYRYYTITVSVGNGVGGQVLGGGQVQEGDSVTLTAVPDEGYEFESWTSQGEVVGTEPELTIESVTEDLELQANFKLLEAEPDEEEPDDSDEGEEAEDNQAEEEQTEILKEEPVKEPVQVKVVSAAGGSVKTGDSSDTEIFILLLFASSLAMVQIIRVGWRTHG